MKDKVYLGIDPGINGGIAGIRIQEDGSTLVNAFKCPRDLTDMANNVRIFTAGVESENVHIIIEQVHSMPKQGVKSTFTFGVNYGAWLGILGCLELTYDKVRPQAWQSIYDKSGFGTEYKDRKNGLKNLAIKLFPNHKITLYTCDALLIANYCKTIHNRKDNNE